MSPTQRTLDKLRSAGYIAEVVERWNPHARVRHDLFGFVDVLAVRDGEVLAVQATSRSNVAARVIKVAEHPNVGAVRKAGIRIEVHGWAKMAGGRWDCRVVDCS
jgi:carbonic anhydrase